jgi:hypothetical protein
VWQDRYESCAHAKVGATCRRPPLVGRPETAVARKEGVKAQEARTSKVRERGSGTGWQPARGKRTNEATIRGAVALAIFEAAQNWSLPCSGGHQPRKRDGPECSKRKAEKATIAGTEGKGFSRTHELSLETFAEVSINHSLTFPLPSGFIPA